MRAVFFGANAVSEGGTRLLSDGPRSLGSIGRSNLGAYLPAPSPFTVLYLASRRGIYTAGPPATASRHRSQAGSPHIVMLGELLIASVKWRSAFRADNTIHRLEPTWE